MKKNLIFFIGVFVLIISGSFEYSTPLGEESNDRGQEACAASNYPNDFTFVEVPDPLSETNPLYKLVTMDEPNVGETFNDYHFQTELTRVTQRGKIRHEYSRFDPFNMDQSMIILHNIESGAFVVYSTDSMPYEQNTNLVRTLSTIDEDPRWDPQDPNLIWGLREFSIVRLNLQTGTETIIKDFSKDATIGTIITAEPDLYRITMYQEGESSYDNRYWAFILQGTLYDYRVRYIFTWDQEQDKVLGVYTISDEESGIDWIGMSPLGNWVLIGGDWDNGGNLAGLTMANKELTQFQLLESTAGHSDIGLDTDGNEVIVFQNTSTDHIEIIRLDWNTTNRLPLVLLFYSFDSPHGLVGQGVHVSCNYPGYSVISTYLDQGEEERNWLHRTNILVKLDWNNPRAFYLSKVYNTCHEYWEETHATISNDGSKIVWASNWNNNVGQEQIFVMQLDMPSNWDDTPVTTTTSLPVTTTAGPSTTTTINGESSTTTSCVEGDLCCIELTYGEDSEETKILRHIRDNVLSHTSEGQELTKLYYEWSPAIVKAMEEDEEFRGEVKEMVDGVLTLITKDTN